eukprot:scaffold2830_cov123-Isochrysis_galbana.AAC.27
MPTWRRWAEGACQCGEPGPYAPLMTSPIYNPASPATTPPGGKTRAPYFPSWINLATLHDMTPLGRPMPRTEREL